MDKKVLVPYVERLVQALCSHGDSTITVKTTQGNKEITIDWEAGNGWEGTITIRKPLVVLSSKDLQGIMKMLDVK